MLKLFLTVFFISVTAVYSTASDSCRVRKYNFQDKYNPMNGYYIEKSDNKNVVFYDINLTSTGELNPRAPLEAYWHLYAEDGRRESLSLLERKLAYGLRKIRERVKGEHYSARVSSMDRDIEIKKSDNCTWVEIPINGRMARLERIMLELRGSVVFASLVYMDIYGQDMETGEDVVERWYYDKTKRAQVEAEQSSSN